MKVTDKLKCVLMMYEKYFIVGLIMNHIIPQIFFELNKQLTLSKTGYYVIYGGYTSV